MKASLHFRDGPMVPVNVPSPLPPVVRYTEHEFQLVSEVPGIGGIYVEREADESKTGRDEA